MRAPTSKLYCYNYENTLYILTNADFKFELKFVTIQNLKILNIDTENNLIILKGAVPGHKGSIIKIVDVDPSHPADTTEPVYVP